MLVSQSMDRSDQGISNFWYLHQQLSPFSSFPFSAPGQLIAKSCHRNINNPDTLKWVVLYSLHVKRKNLFIRELRGLVNWEGGPDAMMPRELQREPVLTKEPAGS